MTEQELSDLAVYGTVMPIDSTGYAPGSTVAEAAKYFGFTRDILADFRKAVTHVSNSNRLTPEGKAQDLGALALDYLPRLDRFGSFLVSAQKELDKLRASMTITSTDDATAQAIIYKEIRDRLPKDKFEVQRVYSQAIADGEQDTFDAIRRAPKFFDLLPKETIAKGEQDWNQKRDPAKSKLIADLDNAITRLKKGIEVAQSAIRTEAGVPQPNYLEQMASGNAA